MKQRIGSSSHSSYSAFRHLQRPKCVYQPLTKYAFNASKDAMIAALQKRVRGQAEKIMKLEKQLEVASSSLYQSR